MVTDLVNVVSVAVLYTNSTMLPQLMTQTKHYWTISEVKCLVNTLPSSVSTEFIYNDDEINH